MYCSTNTLFEKVRGTEDEYNSVAAAVTTGVLFKSTGKIKNIQQISFKVRMNMKRQKSWPSWMKFIFSKSGDPNFENFMGEDSPRPLKPP